MAKPKSDSLLAFVGFLLNMKCAPSKLMPLRRLESAVRQERRRGRRMVFTNGCFDILHIGHVSYLQAARKLGDYLVVAVNSDASVRRLKGSGRPLNNHRDRAQLLGALACVDYVVVFGSKRVTPLLTRLKPEIYAKGGDYAEDALDARERAAVLAGGGKIRILPLWKGHSTTALIQKIQS